VSDEDEAFRKFMAAVDVLVAAVEAPDGRVAHADRLRRWGILDDFLLTYHSYRLALRQADESITPNPLAG
jgi:hypothetical protein